MPNGKEGTIDATRVFNRVKAAGWSFKTEAPRRMVYRKPGHPIPLMIPKNARFAEKTVRELLRFAGLSPEDIEVFIGGNIDQ